MTYDVEAKAAAAVKSGLDKWETTDRMNMDDSFTPVVAEALREARRDTARKAVALLMKAAERGEDHVVSATYRLGAALIFRVLLDNPAETKP